MKDLRKILTIIAVVCVVLGVFVCLVMIWGDVDDEFAWKGLGTLAVVLFGCVITLQITRAAEDAGSSGG
jgi:hypothetical protein